MLIFAWELMLLSLLIVPTISLKYETMYSAYGAVPADHDLVSLPITDYMMKMFEVTFSHFYTVAKYESVKDIYRKSCLIDSAVQ